MGRFSNNRRSKDRFLLSKSKCLFTVMAKPSLDRLLFFANISFSRTFVGAKSFGLEPSTERATSFLPWDEPLKVWYHTVEQKNAYHKYNEFK